MGLDRTINGRNTGKKEEDCLEDVHADKIRYVDFLKGKN